MSKTFLDVLLGRDRELQDAAREFTVLARELLVNLPDSYGCYMTCLEAEAAAALFRAAGDDDAAAEIIAGHARHDEPGALHREAPAAPPMDDKDVLAALAALWGRGGWRRLEITRKDAVGYGGWCVPANGPWAWTSDMLADMAACPVVLCDLADLADACGWKRLQVIGEPGRGAVAGWCQRADGSIIALADVLPAAARVPHVTVPRYAAPRVTVTPVTQVISQKPAADWGPPRPGHYQSILLDTRTGEMSFHESAQHLEPRAWPRERTSDVPRTTWERWYPGTLFPGTYGWTDPVPGLLRWVIDSGVTAFPYLDADGANALLAQVAPHAQDLLDNLFSADALDWSVSSVRTGRDIAGLCSRHRKAAGHVNGMADFADIVARFPQAYTDHGDFTATLYPGEPMAAWSKDISACYGVSQQYPDALAAFGAPWPGYDSGALHMDVLGARAWHETAAGLAPCSSTPAGPMTDQDVLAALTALLADSGWLRLEITREDPATYGGYCIPDQDRTAYIADLLARNDGVAGQLAALLDASGWQRLEAFRAGSGYGGWCERADGSGVHLGGAR